MAHALVLKAADPAGESSPEMRFLLSDFLLQVRRAFGEATLRVVGDEEPGSRRLGNGEELTGAGAGEAFSHALLLGAADVMVRTPSLARMRSAVDSGTGSELAGSEPRQVVAVPRRLVDTALVTGAEVYSLSDFERLEASYLDTATDSFPSPSATAPLASPCLADLRPAALTSLAGLRRLLADHTPATLVGAGSGDPSEGPGDPAPTPDQSPLPSGLEVVSAGLCHQFIDYYGEVRSDITAYLPKGVEDVLEIGCGRGVTGAHLQAELGCRVTGVELNPAVGRDAEGRLHRVVIGDVEEPATLAQLDAGYDAVLALELFEHLVEPERFLDRIRPLVRPGGRIVLSVPNVGHHSVVRDLLAGRWDYLPIGILCYTHYRFYTRRTLVDWLARCGFPDARLVPQRTAAPEWLPAMLEEGPGLAVDAESLSTKGFYVLLEV